MLDLHRQNHHLQSVKMQAPLDRQRCLIVQQTNEPFVRLEDQFAGEKNRIRISPADVFTLMGDFINDIRAKAQRRSRRHAMAMTKIDEKFQGGIGFGPHQFDCPFTTVGMRIDGACINKNEVLEMSGEHALDP